MMMRSRLTRCSGLIWWSGMMFPILVMMRREIRSDGILAIDKGLRLGLGCLCVIKLHCLPRREHSAWNFIAGVPKRSKFAARNRRRSSAVFVLEVSRARQHWWEHSMPAPRRCLCAWTAARGPGSASGASSVQQRATVFPFTVRVKEAAGARSGAGCSRVLQSCCF
jgi:hypothetical protein